MKCDYKQEIRIYSTRVLPVKETSHKAISTSYVFWRQYIEFIWKHFTRRKSFKKAILDIRLAFTGTQISTIIHTPSYVLCILPKVVEAKQVESIIFWKNKQKYILNNKDLCNNNYN